MGGSASSARGAGFTNRKVDIIGRGEERGVEGAEGGEGARGVKEGNVGKAATRSPNPLEEAKLQRGTLGLIQRFTQRRGGGLGGHGEERAFV